MCVFCLLNVCVCACLYVRIVCSGMCKYVRISAHGYIYVCVYVSVVRINVFYVYQISIYMCLCVVEYTFFCDNWGEVGRL